MYSQFPSDPRKFQELWIGNIHLIVIPETHYSKGSGVLCTYYSKHVP